MWGVLWPIPIAGQTAAGNMARTFHLIDYVKISIYGFGLSALASSFSSIILPVKILGCVPEAHKNAYLAGLTSFGLLLALLVQPMAGAISDSSRWRWGRRRPYILLGTLFAVVFSLMAVLSSSYISVFIGASLLQIASNIAQGPYQAFIPDLVPNGRRGTASGVKSVVEMLGILVCSRVVGYLVDCRLIKGGNVWLVMAVGFLGAVLLAVMLVTVFAVKEHPAAPLPSASLLKGLLSTFKIDVDRRSDFAYFLPSRLFMVIAASSIQAFMFYFVRDTIGVTNPARYAMDILVVAGVGTLIAGLPAGRLSDRVGRKMLIALSGAGGIMALLLLHVAQSYGHLLFAAALAGLSIGTFMSTNWALATDLVPQEEAARYLGLTNIATAGGAILARLHGPAIDFLNGRRPGFGYSALFVVCILYILVGTGLILGVRTPRDKLVKQPQ